MSDLYAEGALLGPWRPIEAPPESVRHQAEVYKGRKLENNMVRFRCQRGSEEGSYLRLIDYCITQL